jgi:NAD(P)-dependent dehydrogenase (short-subunit alcohol dehydrogenase family)
MMARALALNGANKVYIVGRRKEVVENASKSVSTNNIIPLVGDVTSKEALSSIVSHITSEVGYINLLVANSGILGPQAAQKITSESTVADFQKAWGESSFEEFADTFKLNTVAVWYTMLETKRVMWNKRVRLLRRVVLGVSIEMCLEALRTDRVKLLQRT